jgi:hypothetical protein
MEMSGLSASRANRFTHREIVPGTHWMGGSVGPTADLQVTEKNRLTLHGIELDPAARRYTATLKNRYIRNKKKLQNCFLLLNLGWLKA